MLQLCLPVLRHQLALLVVGMAAVVVSAHAGSPMVVDDADIVDARSCQLESWVQRASAGNEYWMLPACNFTGNVEWTLGALRVSESGERGHAVAAQAKILLRPLETDGWGAAVALGVVSGRHDGDRGRDWSVSAPVSWSLRGDAVLIHANLGWQQTHASRTGGVTWGLGTETRLGNSSWLLAEVYDEEQGAASFQLGLRHALVADRVEIDLAVGDRLGSTRDRHVALGLRLLSRPFLGGR